MILNLRSPNELSGFYIVYHGACRNESDGIYGISHLMEHLVCKTYQDLEPYFEAEGINSNAYTSNDDIVFHITGLEKNLSKFREMILERIINFDITEEEFEIERMIVLQEYDDYFSRQEYNHSLNLYRKLFNSYGPIGKREDLKALTYQNCLDYFDIQYSRPSKIINVSRGRDFQPNIEFSQKALPFSVEYSQGGSVMIEKRDFVTSDNVSLKYLSKVIKEDFTKVSFICQMLSGGLLSPLFKEIREKKGLVYHIGCYPEKFFDDCLVTISTSTNQDKIDSLNESLYQIFSKPEDYLTMERFLTVKSSLEIGYQKQDILRYKNVEEYIAPSTWDMRRDLSSQRLDDLLDIFPKYFTLDDYYKSRDDKEFS